MKNTDFINLTFTQCKQLKANGYEIQDFIDQIQNQPEFIQAAGWIDSICELQAIQQGGCASGAYMPAVTYSTALDVMSKHGNDVLEFIGNILGELPTPPVGESWAGMAVFYLSYAVELWAGQFDLHGVDWD
jgi:hypothetical protein